MFAFPRCFSSRPAVSMVTCCGPCSASNLVERFFHYTYTMIPSLETCLSSVSCCRGDGFETSRRCELIATHQQSGGLMWMYVCLSLLAVAVVVLLVQQGKTELTFEFLGSSTQSPPAHTLLMACFKGCIPASCLQLGYFLKMMNRLVKPGAHKKTPAQVQSIELQTWTEPSADAISTGSKVLWGYWHTGRENLHPFCELCVRTWEARHPKWTVVILSDSSFKTYVSPSDMPSTFESLKVQHRSDIVRFAVLRRFGAST